MDLVMDSETKLNYDYSISNFIMLKVFHDAGVTITGLSQFMMDVNYNYSANADIFFEGIRGIFVNAERLSLYDDEDDSEFKEMTEALDMSSDYAYKMSDWRLAKVFGSSLKEEFIKEAETATNYLAEHCEFDIKVDLHYGIVVFLEWEGMMHEIAEAVVTIHDLLDQYINRLEGN
ncbi:hypothetical protein AWM68_17770 [Fictibacillus phosphorivorans]|uniref:Uncharacterized protein n=1 Tax=Fictibacillus phosphorivorans TaxID=1221500 RepID=A0A163S2R0_9BACL|nr:hypothetical protein [Fictibacillus phosphorivorans]KZE68018.1 hypothetical protein AWM68_17770 [Fictibacillus phosphorivorans]